MSEWKPIESAPKDGTWVLIFDKTEWSDFYDPCMVARFRNGVWRGEGASSKGVVRASVTEAESPTHWMPLPEPPTDAAE